LQRPIPWAEMGRQVDQLNCEGATVEAQVEGMSRPHRSCSDAQTEDVAEDAGRADVRIRLVLGVWLGSD
jgi:hypothetical protein